MSEYPENNDGKDVGLAITKTFASLIPVAGAPAVELLNAIVTPSLQKRRDDWFKAIGERIKKLEENSLINIDELSTNEEFVDFAIKTTELAIKTSKELKKEALRNALINSITQHSIDESKKYIFLDYIDSFTEWHIKLLKLLDEAPKYKHLVENVMAGGLSILIEGVYEELKGQKSFYSLIFKELYTKGLINTSEPSGTMTSSGIVERRSSSFGQEFIRFISE